MENWEGAIQILKAMGIKPNYSELSRIYKVDRKTIKKYDEGYSRQFQERKRQSKLDKHQNMIKEKIGLPGAKIMGTYQYFKNEVDSNIGSYSNFKKYIHKNNLMPNKANKVHLRFETAFGKQLQFDWKEEIKMVSKYGEDFTFNIFAATLCASRMHIFIYSKTKTRQDVERCLIETFRYIKGVPKESLTDIMSSIISTKTKKIYPEFYQFCRDMGTTLKKCKPRSPETKGKDESCNRFINWLIPYNHEFETEEELVKVILKITNRVNSTVNQTTGVTPFFLYNKEKEYLQPLPNNKIINSYLNDTTSVKVSCESLIYYRGSKYSVPIKYIGLAVKIKELDNKLYIYYNSQLISLHEISDKVINYREEDYIEGLKTSITNKNIDIETLAIENLKLFDNLVKTRKEN
jgi:transposase